MTAPNPKITLLEALEACWEFGDPYPSYDGALRRLMDKGHPYKLAEYKLFQLADKGYIDYGVSVACPWRTEKGEAKMKELRHKGT